MERECHLVRVACPYGCGAKFLRMKTQHHLMEECVRAEVECPECEVNYLMRDVESHSCTKELKEIIKALKDELTIAKQKINSQQNTISELTLLVRGDKA